MYEEQKREAYYKIPQRTHDYGASDKAKEIVHKSITIDTLFSGVVPIQWSKPDAPELHDEMDKVKAAGFSCIGACSSADAADTSLQGALNSLKVWIKRIDERPEKYRIVRTAADIDKAIAEDKLGIYFTHQGTGLFEGDPDKVGLMRQLGFGYCLLAYNARNPVGDGCFEADNSNLTTFGKFLVDAYNRYGMIVDVSHTGERTALGAIERSSDPVISSHSGAKAINNYPRGHSDELIKAIGESGGVQCVNTVGGFMDPTNPDVVTTDVIFQHIDHIASLIGIDHVGYASDYVPDVYISCEMGKGPLADLLFPDPDGRHMFPEMCAKGTPTPAPYQFIAALVDKMLEKGYSEEDCGKVIGGNVYRLFKQVWK